MATVANVPRRTTLKPRQKNDPIVQNNLYLITSLLHHSVNATRPAERHMNLTEHR